MSETGYQCPECSQWHRTRENLRQHRLWAHPEYQERELEELIIRRRADRVGGSEACWRHPERARWCGAHNRSLAVCNATGQQAP